MINKKQCSKCKIIKYAKEFYKNKCHSDGLYSQCKDCQKILSRNWTKNNMHKHSVYVKNWNEKNPEKIKEYSKTHNTKEKKIYEKEKWIRFKKLRNNYLPGLAIDKLSKTNRINREKIYDEYNVPKE